MRLETRTEKVENPVRCNVMANALFANVKSS